MSKLLDIQEQLFDTIAAIAELERATAIEPNSPSLRSMTKSLQKRYEILESEFKIEANNLGIDVCPTCGQPITEIEVEAGITPHQ